MDGEWKTVQFSDAVWVNPSVPLKRGDTYPFVEMQDVNPSKRATRSRRNRLFTGSGSRFAIGDTLMARITPCLENGKTARFISEEDKAFAHGSTEFIVIRGRPSVSDTNFAYYLTRWRGENDSGKLEDMAGFCNSATTAAIEKHGFVLTPGRYVDAEDDGEPFPEKMARLTKTLGKQFDESDRLEKKIRGNLKGLGFQFPD